MANHPNRAPQHDETVADLVARHPERLNILVGGHTLTGPMSLALTRPAGAVAVRLRYGYTPVILGDDDNRPVGCGVDGLPDGSPDLPGIRRAVMVLRAAWGMLHVQDNSGTVPDLDQGKWAG